MNRRMILKAFAACFAAASFPSIEAFYRGGGRGAAARIGQVYLSNVPDEADARLLRGLLGSAPSDRRDGDWKAHFDSLKQSDFSKGDAVVIDGWLFARCEARFCALLTFA